MTADETSGTDNNSKPDSDNPDIRNSFDHVQNEILDTKITLNEIEKVIANFKNSKAAGFGKIILELIKALEENFFALLLNNILDNGVFSEEWTLGVVIILFKKGVRSDLNNHRGITLLSMLGKMLVVVLNSRLTKFVQQAAILLGNQCGFRKWYQCG